MDIGAFLENFYMEMAIGAIIFALGFSVRYLKSIYWFWKYPVHGKYKSYFEDVVGGERIVQKSEAQITQKGSYVQGKDNLRSSDQVWYLEGNLLNKKHIAGIYKAEGGAGIGVFYLERHINKNLLGYWCGHDEINKITSSGKYDLIKIENTKIRDFIEDDRGYVLDIIVENLGQGYCENVPDLDNRNFILVSQLRKKPKKVVGFVYAGMGIRASLDTLSEKWNITPTADVKAAHDAGTLGEIRIIAIKSEYQGKGIGTSLIEEAENRLKDLGSETIIVPAWSGSNGINLGKILEYEKYSDWATVKDYWKEECDKGDFSCPHRTNNECVCDVVFFRKSTF